MSADVAIVVLSYNHPDLTARAVRSALEHHAPVYLVHNGSTLENRQKLEAEFPAINHVVLEENKGYSGGSNAGLNRVLARHAWAILLTNDCELVNLPELPEFPAVVVPQISRRKSEKVDSLGGGFHAASGTLRHLREAGTLESGWRHYVPGSAFAVHQTVWRKTGGFVEALGTYWEDVDWSVRAQNGGFVIKPNSDWKVTHGIGKTCRKDPLYTIYFYHRNRTAISWKHAAAQEKPLLAWRLMRSFGGQAVRLVKQKRYSDLKLLFQAARDSFTPELLG